MAQYDTRGYSLFGHNCQNQAREVIGWASKQVLPHRWEPGFAGGVIDGSLSGVNMQLQDGSGLSYKPLLLDNSVMTTSSGINSQLVALSARPPNDGSWLKLIPINPQETILLNHKHNKGKTLSKRVYHGKYLPNLYSLPIFDREQVNTNSRHTFLERHKRALYNHTRIRTIYESIDEEYIDSKWLFHPYDAKYYKDAVDRKNKVCADEMLVKN